VRRRNLVFVAHEPPDNPTPTLGYGWPDVLVANGTTVYALNGQEATFVAIKIATQHERSLQALDTRSIHHLRCPLGERQAPRELLDLRFVRRQ
jgi:hypothetical protein